jgi:amino acid permease
MTKTYLKGIGMLIGMIFGAGIFALPFAVYKAGIFWGMLHFFIAFVLMIFLHLWYGEIAYFTEGKHRFTGYVEKILGKSAEKIAFLTTFFTYYGALAVYGILGGIFLATFFPLKTAVLSLMFFAAGGILIFLHFEKIAVINFYSSVALLGLVIFLFIIAFPNIKIANFPPLNFGFFSGWFLPYGVWLFALAGFAVIPEVRDIIVHFPVKNLRYIILISLILCTVFYLIFISTVIGISGVNTTEDALAGLAAALGFPALLIGSIVGFLAVFTSFIALGADLKNIFHYDFHFQKWLAWICVSLPPVALFLFGATNFVKILSIIGSAGLGIMGIFVILMIERLRKPSFTWVIKGMLIAGVIAAVISSF